LEPNTPSEHPRVFALRVSRTDLERVLALMSKGFHAVAVSDQTVYRDLWHRLFTASNDATNWHDATQEEIAAMSTPSPFTLPTGQALAGQSVSPPVETPTVVPDRPNVEASSKPTYGSDLVLWLDLTDLDMIVQALDFCAYQSGATEHPQYVVTRRKVAEVAERYRLVIPGENGQIGVGVSVPSAAAPEKPKRKRRTAAEMQAVRDAERAQIEAANAALGHTAPTHVF